MATDKLPLEYRVKDLPKDFRHDEGKHTNARGLDLAYVTVLPPKNHTLRGVIVFLHGVGEHCRRYYALYEELCKNDFGVFAYDLISHGMSDNEPIGERATVEDFRHFVEDTNEMIAHAKTSVLPPFLGDKLPPIALCGFSLGSLVSTLTALSAEHELQALILAGPALSLEMTLTLRLYMYLAKPLASFFPTARIVPAVNPDYISRRPGFLDDMEQDPLVTTGNATICMGVQSLVTMQALETDERVTTASSAFCQLPVLMLMGTEDKVTSLESAREFYNRIANEDKEFREFDGLYHAIFDEPEREEVIQSLVSWLKNRFPLH